VEHKLDAMLKEVPKNEGSLKKGPAVPEQNHGTRFREF
jgi:hypothetical protein